MKTILSVLLITATAAIAATPPVKEKPAEVTTFTPRTNAYAAGQFNLSPFVGLKLTEWSKSTGKWGGGLALSYTVVENIEAEVSAFSYKLQDDPVIETFDEGAVNFRGYLPLGYSGFAPYGLIGYTRDHANDENLMNVGAGLAYKTGRLRAFTEGQYRRDPSDERGNQFFFKAGVGFSF